jgi:hypothetical protein
VQAEDEESITVPDGCNDLEEGSPVNAVAKTRGTGKIQVIKPFAFLRF